ncbi:interferon-induced protein 44-like [Montipora capricornis]|uniref:interferon-induced protein 44-like n=1 Tax=Montipora foliosa TaxID=591990 RepID=UPI0035F1B5D0
MGGSESQIVHKTVDNTDRNAGSEGERQAREENEKRVRDLENQLAKQREQALLDAQQRARCEDESERKRLDEQKRKREEEEKKMKEEKEFLELQKALISYDFKERPRIKKESFRDLDVSDIDLVRIALIGPTGSGKTSFVATVQQALKRNPSAFEQGTGKEGTIYLEEYAVHEHVRIVDTRGFFQCDEKLFDECLNIMTGRIRPGEEIKREYEQEKGGDAKQQPLRKTAELAKFAHAVLFVVKANDPRLKDYMDKLKKIRNHFREEGYSPVTVITYLDKIKGEDQKEDAFDHASKAIGSASQRTYFIANYTDKQKETSLTAERTALDVLEYSLMSAESFIQIRKQREKNQMERNVEAGGASSGVEKLEQFFARLKMKHKWNDQGKVKEVLSILRKNEINTVKALKDMWEDVKPELPLSIGMKRCMEEEISNI